MLGAGVEGLGRNLYLFWFIDWPSESLKGKQFGNKGKGR